MIVLKVLGPEANLASNTTVSNNVLIRVLNPGAAAVLHIGNAANTEYANVTVANTEQGVVIVKLPTDTLQGNGMFGVPVAYRG
ncbi:MAG: hypothetical protein ACHQU0_03075 [Candidatus Paceibacteria bacterium]